MSQLLYLHQIDDKTVIMASVHKNNKKKFYKFLDDFHVDDDNCWKDEIIACNVILNPYVRKYLFAKIYADFDCEFQRNTKFSTTFKFDKPLTAEDILQLKETFHYVFDVLQFSHIEDYYVEKE